MVRKVDVGDALEAAWGLIANASDWVEYPKSEKYRLQWVAAAERWRDNQFHPWLDEQQLLDSEEEGEEE